MAEEKIEAEETLSVVVSNRLFTQQLYNVLLKQKGNIFCSPISAHAVLSMAYQGSQRDTYAAFTKALNIQNHDVAAAGYKNILTKLNNARGVELSLVNKIYLSNDCDLNQPFKEVLETKFQSATEQINFAENKTAVKLINNWLAKQTKNKIKNLIGSDDLDESTKLVLISAIYFKGKWCNKFDPKDTETANFYLNDNDSIKVQMMSKTSEWYYKEDKYLDAQILDIHYVNPKFSLLLLLPNKKNGIGELEKKIADQNLANITNGMHSSRLVHLNLAKFKIEATMNWFPMKLENALSQLRLEIIFKNSADFGRMLDPPQGLVVSKIIQKAFIEVNEVGSEMAFVCVAQCGATGPEIPIEFIVDHPFILIMKTNGISMEANIPLFIGRVVNPRQ